MKNNFSFTIKGMHCASCEKIIKMELEDLKKGLENIQIDHKTGKGSLKYDPNLISPDLIMSTIKKTGYEANKS